MERVLDKDITVSSIQDKVTALDELELLVEDIDNAKGIYRYLVDRFLADEVARRFHQDESMAVAVTVHPASR